MYPVQGRNHQFLYHAYALALGGWVHDRHGQLTSLPNLAPSVLSITGGYASACEKHVNFVIPGLYGFGAAPAQPFQLYVGRAYSEVRGDLVDDKQYVTRVRSILEDVRINDDFYVQHAEAALESRHDRPENGSTTLETEVLVGDSTMSGVHVRGEKVELERHADPDRHPRYGELRSYVDRRRRRAVVGAAVPQTGGGGDTSLEGLAELSDDDRDWINDLCNWHDPEAPDATEGYVKDIATMNRDAKDYFRYSLFKDVSVLKENGIKSSFKSSIDVDDFGRIFLGEVIASHGTKQVQMFRIDLGCDNCGGVGGSGGSTNGGSMP
jgi:hypothetical protein